MLRGVATLLLTQTVCSYDLFATRTATLGSSAWVVPAKHIDHICFEEGASVFYAASTEGTEVITTPKEGRMGPAGMILTESAGCVAVGGWVYAASDSTLVSIDGGSLLWGKQYSTNTKFSSDCKRMMYYNSGLSEGLYTQCGGASGYLGVLVTSASSHALTPKTFFSSGYGGSCLDASSGLLFLPSEKLGMLDVRDINPAMNSPEFGKVLYSFSVGWGYKDCQVAGGQLFVTGLINIAAFLHVFTFNATAAERIVGDECCTGTDTAGVTALHVADVGAGPPAIVFLQSRTSIAVLNVTDVSAPTVLQIQYLDVGWTVGDIAVMGSQILVALNPDDVTDGSLNTPISAIFSYDYLSPNSEPTIAPTTVPITTAPTASPTTTPQTASPNSKTETNSPTIATTPAPIVHLVTARPTSASPTTTPTASPTTAPQTASPNIKTETDSPHGETQPPSAQTDSPTVATTPAPIVHLVTARPTSASPTVTVAPTTARVDTTIPTTTTPKTTAPSPATPAPPTPSDTTPPPPASSASSGGGSTVIIAAAASSALAVCLLGALAWFCRRRHRGAHNAPSYTDTLLPMDAECVELDSAGSRRETNRTTEFLQYGHSVQVFDCAVEGFCFGEMQETDLGSTPSLLGPSEARMMRRVGPFFDASLVGWKPHTELGRGAFGVVYKGSCGGPAIAMKAHSKVDESDVSAASDQIRCLQEMGPHPNLVSVLDMIYVCDTQCLCIFMECISGPTLHTLSESGVEEGEAARLMAQIVSGVKHLHSHSLLHRDIKGDNVLLTPDLMTAKLCDFGLLKAMQTLQEQTEDVNTLAGTPGWMAPEVADRLSGFVAAGKPSDIYSIGCTLSETLNRGQPPGPLIENVWNWVGHKGSAPPSIASGISTPAAEFITACLQPRPEDRPTIAQLETHTFLEAFLSATSHETTTLSEEEMIRCVKGKVLGRGAFGTVYLGQLPDARQVAVKVLAVKGAAQGQVQCAQAEAEFRICESLDHPNIVAYYGHRWTEGGVDIFLELVTGGTVRDFVRTVQNGRLMDSVITVYLRQVLDALCYLHKGGRGRLPIAHRDLKGDNLLIDKSGKIKLADFGCSKLFSGDEGTATFVGTPNWMAPEVLSMRGGGGGGGLEQYCTKCDLWSLGCTVIEMLGHTPWREGGGETTFDVMSRIASSSTGPPLPDNVSPLLQDFLATCFKRNPAERATAEELLASPYIEQGQIAHPGVAE